MKYQSRAILLLVFDAVMIFMSIYIAVLIAYPSYPAFTSTALLVSAIILVIAHYIFASLFNLYNKMWEYASVGELISIFLTVTLAVTSMGIIQCISNDFTFYFRGFFVTWMLYLLAIGGSRFIWRVVRDQVLMKKSRDKRTLIVGAGDAGAMIARQLSHGNNGSELKPIAFIDDDLRKQGKEVYSLPVVGSVKDIPWVVEKLRIEHIVIAIPSLSRTDLSKIVDTCATTGIKMQMIPKLEDLMTGKVSVSNLKNVEVEDLLGRDPVELDISAINQHIRNQTVMVTGAGGSIGSEICRQLSRFNPKEILLVGHGEYSIYQINQELMNESDVKSIPLIGDVKDKERIKQIVKNYQPKIIYHAAAHKHVPLMEANPHETIKNNVIGTKNVAEVASEEKVETFVLVSTDKAVNPTNVMGASKRIAEMIVQHMSKRSETNFVAVRFGNVLGSRGSVIPLFQKQIEAGGPVTVTHPEMTRYFMTIPEASRLVIQAGSLAKGGEIFVLDMGDPVKIVDLARNLIKLSDYTEDEIPIEFTDLRPGEKMYEELLGEGEVHPEEVYEKIYIGRTLDVNYSLIDALIKNFKSYSNEELKERMMEIVYEGKETSFKEQIN